MIPFHEMTPATRRRLVCLSIISLLIPLGVLCRFVPLGLPLFIVKYGGSVLWAAMVYWLIALILARQKPVSLGLIALSVTAAVEFLKKVQSPGLNAFRDTFAGKVMLGRYFSYTDIVFYWLTIVCVVWLDSIPIHSPLISRD